MQSTPELVNGLHQFWPWMWHTFGVSGTLLVLFLALLLCCAWVITPVGVWLLHRKGRRLDQQMQELLERTASQNRQQQVERLQRDSVRKKPRRRH